MPNRIIDGRDNPLQRTGVYKPIVSILFTAMVAFIFFRLGDRLWIDLLSTSIISFAFIQGALVVGALTEDWKWRIAGLFVAIGGTGLAYAFLFGNASGHADINTLAVRSTLRASLFVGSIILIIGTWAYLWNRRKHQKDPAVEAYLDPRSYYRK